MIESSRLSNFLLEDLSFPIRGVDPNTGTGPYRLTSRTDQETVLDKFDAYHQGRPSIDRVVLLPYKELRISWANLLRAQVDMVSDVPASSIEFIQNDEIEVFKWQRWYQFVIAFNSGQGPMRSPAVRRALNIAVDREVLVNRVLQGMALPSNGPIWPEYWAYDRSVAPYPYDPASAKSLLDAAGYRPGSSNSTGTGVPHARLRFTCLIPEGYSVLERVGMEIQRQLYEVGVDMQFETVPTSLLDDRLKRGKFDAVLVDMISGPSWGRPYLFWRSARNGKGLNIFGYENRDVERLFESLRTSINDAAVITATSRLQQVMRDDPPALFLAWNTRARAVRREFNVHQEQGRDPLSTLWRWTPESARLAASAR